VARDITQYSDATLEEARIESAGIVTRPEGRDQRSRQRLQLTNHVGRNREGSTLLQAGGAQSAQLRAAW
jgi:hypothetical protein